MERPSLMRPDPEAVPLREAAARRGLSRGWAATLCREGRFPARAFRVGRNWYVARADLDRLLRARLGEDRQGAGPGDRSRGRGASRCHVA